jgi:phage-related protein
MAGDAGMSNPVQAIADATKKSINWLADAWNKTVGFLRDVWLWIYDRVIMPILNGLRTVWLWIYDSVIMPILNGLRTVWLWIYDSVIMPILNGLRAVWLWIYDSVIMPIFDGLRAVWDGIMQVLINVFSSIGEGLTALFDGIGAVFSELWKAGSAVFAAIPELFAGIWNAGRAMFSAIPEIFSKIWSAFEGVFGRLGDIGKNIMRSLTDGLSNIGSGISDMFAGIGRMFSSLFKIDMSGVAKGIEEAFSKAGDFLKDAFRGVINPIVDVFNGLIGMLDGFKIPALSVGVPKWAGGGKWDLWNEIDLIPGDIGRIAKFAKGGMVEGPGGTDTVPAWLTAGEFVVNRQAVREIGLPALQALNGGRSAIGGNTTQHITLNLKIETKERIDDNFVKQRLMPAIRDELRRGSLDGRAVVYAGGVRA